jgi:hypothetical protein
VTPPLRALVNGALRRHVRLAPRLQRAVDEFAARHLRGHFVISVHVRATDHVFEFASNDSVRSCGVAMECGLAAYYRAIDEVLEQRRREATDQRPTRIFVASDNNEAIRNLTRRYGEDAVVHHATADSLRTSDTFDSGGRGWVSLVRTKQVDRTQLVDAVLVDMWLLAQGDHLVHWDSALPKMACYLNPAIISHYLPGPDEHAFADGSPLNASAVRRRTAEHAQAQLRAIASVSARVDEPQCAGHASCSPEAFCAMLLLSASRPPEGRCVPCSDMRQSAWRLLLRGILPSFPSILSQLAPWGLPFEVCALGDDFAREVAGAMTVDFGAMTSILSQLAHCPDAAAQNWCEWGPCRGLALDVPPASQLPRLPSFLPPNGTGKTPERTMLLHYGLRLRQEPELITQF